MADKKPRKVFYDCEVNGVKYQVYEIMVSDILMKDAETLFKRLIVIDGKELEDIDDVPFAVWHNFIHPAIEYQLQTLNQFFDNN